MFKSTYARLKITFIIVFVSGILAIYWSGQLKTQEVAASEQVRRTLVAAAPEGIDPPAPDEPGVTQPVGELLEASAATDAGPGTDAGFNPGQSNFFIRSRSITIPYYQFGLLSMPGEELDISALGLRQADQGRLDISGGALRRIGEAQWRWQAPAEPGLYPLRSVDELTGESVLLNMFVLTPYDPQQKTLNGFQIGTYEAEPLRGDPAYTRPAGFIELTAENAEVHLSPHFKLRQFRCKQVAEGTYPQYLIIDEKLLLKLEMILEEVNRRGIEASTLHVMSAFRTPYYNKSIGNTTIYSRHLYGDAADIFVDTDGDGVMDDLDEDGQITRADAEFLADIVEDLAQEERYEPFKGGLGIYGPAPHRGPFIHVDVRGTPARW